MRQTFPMNLFFSDRYIVRSIGDQEINSDFNESSKTYNNLTMFLNPLFSSSNNKIKLSFLKVIYLSVINYYIEVNNINFNCSQ